MLSKLFRLSIVSLMTLSSTFLSAVEYEIKDIGTMQARSSQAIDLNNQGQILGWYNIDNSHPSPTSFAGKHYFVRDRDGSFNELPIHNGGGPIDWRYLVDSGKAYGVYDYGSGLQLYMWDQINGVVKLGDLPGKEITAINNAGQVLIKSSVKNENSKSIVGPVIWDNGKITKLERLGSNVGMPSDEAYGLDMNSKGEVVGQSLVYVNYKNDIYKQVHATKWVNGQAVDLHYLLPKTEETRALSINDLGEVLINFGNNIKYQINLDGSYINIGNWPQKLNNNGNSYCNQFVFKGVDPIASTDTLTEQAQVDRDSLLVSVTKFIKINDKGEIIALGKTVYGEEHALLIVPINDTETEKNDPAFEEIHEAPEVEESRQETEKTFEAIIKKTIDAAFIFHTEGIEEKVRLLFLEVYAQDHMIAHQVGDPYRKTLMLEALEEIFSEVEKLSLALQCENDIWFWGNVQLRLNEKYPSWRPSVDAYISLKIALLGWKVMI